MKKNVLTIVVALVLMLAFVVTLVSCEKPDDGDKGGDTLTIAYSEFSNKFSPFFADTSYDQDIATLTQITLLAGDRGGAVVYDGINGETVAYNGTDYTYYGLGKVVVTMNKDGTVDYDITVRSGDKTVYFSDGKPVTIDDVIFSMYALSDTDYDGSSTFYSLPIKGMNEYRTNLSTEIYEKYNKFITDMSAVYAECCAADEFVDYVVKAGDSFTQAQYDSYVSTIWSEGGSMLAKDIVSYCAANYPDYKPMFQNNEIATGMGLWGFGDTVNKYEKNAKGTYALVAESFKALYAVDAAATEPKFTIGETKYVAATEDSTEVFIRTGKETVEAYTGDRYNETEEFDYFIDSNGNKYTLVGEDVPAIEDYVACIKEAYGNNFVVAGKTEAANLGLDDYLNAANAKWMAVNGATEMAGANITSISGIKKTGANSMSIHMTEFSATSIYQLTLSVAPLHYYGSASLYNYESDQFGFPKGDLSSLRAKTTNPMGAGPYKFVSYEAGQVTLERNENYWEGSPKIKYLAFKEYKTDTDKTPALISGNIDVATPSISDEVLSTITKANTNKELVGNVITTSLIDFNGYGYLGICSDVVYVGSQADKGSEASKNLRKGLATVLAAYREYSVNSYYGDRASVIEYPISNCSWAAPQPTDDGYAIAYSKDVDGNAIYTADMTDEQKWDAATKAAVGFFKAAGYTFDATTGKFTAAPEGAKMSYEVMIGGGGTGDHPSMAILVKAKEALLTIGIELVINDLSNTNILWEGLDGGTVAIWAAAWGGSADPDMYQVYHSSNATNSNHYRIADVALDKLIMDARKSADTTYRKSVYKDALAKVLDWGVEVPTYQRKECILFSSERIDIDSITPDVTPYWSYLSEIHTLELK